MLLRNTLAEEGHPVEVPTGVVPRLRTTEVGRTEDSVTYRVDVQSEQPAQFNYRLNLGEQPTPKPNQHPAVWPLVMVDMAGRDKLGRQRYGTPLQPHNGRDTLRDAYEEALDLAVYLRAAIYERDGK